MKILDFGLAKRIPAEPPGTKESTLTALTKPGSTLGTVNYMSPEQTRGAEADYRSDIFSFGAVLYEMASGQKAFPGAMAEAFAAILDREPAPVGDAQLHTVISRALRKNPAERYQSASELRAALEALRHTATPLSRRKLIYGAGSVAVAGAAALATRGIWAPAIWESSGVAKLRTFAVVLIENLTGDPSLDWMDRGLCELLNTALAQSQALALLSTDVVRSAAAHRFGDNGRLTAGRAYDVARDTHADLYASGSLFKPGPGFRLSLRAQETKSGRLVYTGAVEGADAQALFGMTDQAAAAMLAQIVPRPLARPDSAGGLTSNLEALKAYTEAGYLYGPMAAGPCRRGDQASGATGSGLRHGSVQAGALPLVGQGPTGRAHGGSAGYRDFPTAAVAGRSRPLNSKHGTLSGRARGRGVKCSGDGTEGGSPGLGNLRQSFG